jgi:YD repeat-containing protein
VTPDALAPLNLGALLRDGLRLTTAEAIAIVHGACAEVSTGAARAVPAQPGDVWITGAGKLLITAPADAGQGRRSAVAALLEALLPRSSDEAEFAVSDALRTLPTRLRQSGDGAGKDDLRYLLLILSKYLPSNAAGLSEQLARRARERSTTSLKFNGPASTLVASAPSVAESTSVVATPIAPKSTKGDSPPIDNSTRVAGIPVVERGTTVGSAESSVGDLPLSVDGPTFPAPAGAVATNDYFPLIAGSVLLMALSGFVGYRIASNAGELPPVATTTTAEPPSATAQPRIVERDRPRPSESTPVDNMNPAPLDLPVANGAFSPSLSGNGTLLFHAGRNASGQLFTTTVDDHGGVTAAEPLINDGARNYHPRLSPDGTRVAFDSDREGERAVYVADRDGTGITRVSGAGYAAVPSWSPDGTRLAFIKAEPDRARVWNLWLLNVATGELQRHTSFIRGQVWGASWFPDGHRVAYSHEDRLIVSDLQSGADEVQASPVKGRLVRTPAVSPDGRRIVFQVYGNGVWMLDLATEAVRRVLDDVTAEEFAWDPSGRRIAYHSRRAGKWQIWMMPS